MTPPLEQAAPIAIRLDDEAATARAGAALAATLAPGDVVALSGELGAGKTALARAAIAARLAACGGAEEIPSPTFTLVQTYHADVEIWHVDLYRLGEPGEAAELGLDEAFGAAVVLVEWAERLGPLLPARRLDLALGVPPEDAAGRDLVATAVGGGWEAALAALARAAG